MKIVGIIPARYNSTRFPGKILEELAGMPLLWHVFKAAKGCSSLDEVYVATDSNQIEDFCLTHHFPFLVTRNTHQNPTSRVWEAAGQVDADLYVMIGGDEPLLSSEDISLITDTAVYLHEKSHKQDTKTPDVVNAMAVITHKAEVEDPANIKVVCDGIDRCLYASRNVIPSSGRTPEPLYRKFVSIGVYTKASLDFFVATEPGFLEQAEEFDLLRFMEHGGLVTMTDILSHTLSVDLPADLERVRQIFATQAKHKLN